MNTKPTTPATPRVTDTPTLGARVTNRRGGDLPGLAATLRVAELPNERNGRLVLVYDSEGSGRYLHPSLTHEGRWNLGSRTVAFAPGEPDAVAATVPPASPREPELWVRPDATGSSQWHRVEAVPGDDPDQTTACGLLVAQEYTDVYELTPTTPLPVCVGCSEATRCARCQRLCVPEGDGLCPGCYAAGPAGQAAPYRVLPVAHYGDTVTVRRADGTELTGRFVGELPGGRVVARTDSDAATGQLVTAAQRATGGPELHVGSEHQGLSGVWVVCSCGLATRHQPVRLSEAAWSEHRAHALDALREAVSVAHETSPLVAEANRVLPRVTVESVTPEQRDAVCELALATSGVWRRHPTGGVFTDVEWNDRTWYVRLYDGSSGAVGYTPFFGVRSELRLSALQAAQLAAQTRH